MAIVIPAVALSSRRCLFESRPMLGDEVHECLSGMCHDAIRIFAVPGIDGLHTQCPDDLNPGPAIGREGV